MPKQQELLPLEHADLLSAFIAQTNERLNNVIIEFEQKLRRYNFGEDACVLVQKDEDDSELWLWFLKDVRDWRLMTATVTGAVEDDLKPLVNASHEIRTKAIEKFPDLFEALFEAALKSYNALDEKVAKAEEFVNAMPQEKKGAK